MAEKQMRRGALSPQPPGGASLPVSHITGPVPVPERSLLKDCLKISSVQQLQAVRLRRRDGRRKHQSGQPVARAHERTHLSAHRHENGIKSDGSDQRRRTMSFTQRPLLAKRSSTCWEREALARGETPRWENRAGLFMMRVLFFQLSCNAGEL